MPQTATQDSNSSTHVASRPHLQQTHMKLHEAPEEVEQKWKKLDEMDAKEATTALFLLAPSMAPAFRAGQPLYFLGDSPSRPAPWVGVESARPPQGPLLLLLLLLPPPPPALGPHEALQAILEFPLRSVGRRRFDLTAPPTSTANLNWHSSCCTTLEAMLFVVGRTTCSGKTPLVHAAAVRWQGEVLLRRSPTGQFNSPTSKKSRLRKRRRDGFVVIGKHSRHSNQCLPQAYCR